jgi:DNA (cytosine-5)-methyltransferase 1
MAIDLFAGCGGLTQGLHDAGFTVIGAVELDSLAADTYEMNHEDVTIWRKDIRQVSVGAVKKRLGLRKGELDLLAGCPPCEGFSSMRTLNGRKRVKDPRNDLIYEYLRFVEGLRPRALMLENVPGLMRDARWARVAQELGTLGYLITTAVLNTADYGVPQRRRRFIMLASREGVIPFARPARVNRTVADAIGELVHPRRCPDPLHKASKGRSRRIANMIKLIPKNGGSRSDLPRHYKLACHKRFFGFNDVYGRMKWNDVAPTITGGCVNPSKGRFLHPTQDRPITLREAALLQSFPKSYEFPLTRGVYPVAVLIGNALPPEFVRRHALKVALRLRTIDASRMPTGPRR